MFKTRCLKQLRSVQSRIKTCKASLAKLNPPQPDSFQISKNMFHWLSSLFFRNHPDAALLYDPRFASLEDDACDYLHKLGEYFINSADYYKEMRKYKEELAQLQEEERLLKDKLGID